MRMSFHMCWLKLQLINAEYHMYSLVKFVFFVAFILLTQVLCQKPSISFRSCFRSSIHDCIKKCTLPSYLLILYILIEYKSSSCYLILY